MAHWRKLGWACVVILAAAEYSWLAVVNASVPPVPRFLWPLQAVLFPAAVLAMIGTGTFVVALGANALRSGPIRLGDYVAALLCVGLTVAVLRW